MKAPTINGGRVDTVLIETDASRPSGVSSQSQLTLDSPSRFFTVAWLHGGRGSVSSVNRYFRPKSQGPSDTKETGHRLQKNLDANAVLTNSEEHFVILPIDDI